MNVTKEADIITASEQVVADIAISVDRRSRLPVK